MNKNVFQFVIPEGKIQANNTITLEADGDPTTFSMDVKVLKPADGGPMMKLIKYNPVDSYGMAEVANASLIHNHTADGTNAVYDPAVGDGQLNAFVVDSALASNMVTDPGTRHVRSSND